MPKTTKKKNLRGTTEQKSRVPASSHQEFSTLSVSRMHPTYVSHRKSYTWPRLFAFYFTVFLGTSIVAGIFMFLYSGIKTNHISNEIVIAFLTTLNLVGTLTTLVGVWRFGIVARRADRRKSEKEDREIPSNTVSTVT